MSRGYQVQLLAGIETLKATDGNKAEAARRLGVDVKTVRNKLKAYREAGELD